jgi:hypothetical protein
VDLIETLKYNPIPLHNTILDYYGIKLILTSSLYSTSSWPGTADILDKLITNNLTEKVKQDIEDQITVTPELMEESMGLIGIHCSDREARASSLDEFMPAVHKLHNKSFIIGDATDAINMNCAQWKIDAKERYEGDFQVETKNPVLFVGNSYDGHTPIISARNVSSGFEDSVVLEVNGYGVSTSLAPALSISFPPLS